MRPRSRGPVLRGTPAFVREHAVPPWVERAGEVDRSQAFGDRLQAGRAAVLLGRRLGGRGRVQERWFASGIQQAKAVIAFGQVRADGYGSNNRPFKRVAGGRRMPVVAPQPRGRGARPTCERTGTVVQDDGRLRRG